MGSEISMAFAHPHERSLALASDVVLDRISVRDHVVEVEIGAFQAERGITQRIRFNVVVEVTPLTQEIDDDVDCILSYDKITDAISYELKEGRLNLLETLAQNVADRILIEPQAVRVFVRIEKLDRGASDLGVEIMRSFADVHSEEIAPEENLRPKMVYLSNAALGSVHLRTWIDQLKMNETPVLICVDFPDTPRLQTENTDAQRQIDLLAIEQNAWALTALDQRCVVVRTKTELEWAMRNAQLSVWAPAKIVLDAVEGPEVEGQTPLELAAWFAANLQAEELIVIGALLFDGASVKMREHSPEQAQL